MRTDVADGSRQPRLDLALVHRTHLICQVLQLGTTEDVRSLRHALGDDALP